MFKLKQLAVLKVREKFCGFAVALISGGCRLKLLLQDVTFERIIRLSSPRLYLHIGNVKHKIRGRNVGLCYSHRWSGVQCAR